MTTITQQLGGRGEWPPPPPEDYIESSAILQHFECQLTSDSLWRRKLQRLCHYKALFPGLPPHKILSLTRACVSSLWLPDGGGLGTRLEGHHTQNHIYLYINRMNLHTVQTMGNNLFESETFVANLPKTFITLEVQV